VLHEDLHGPQGDDGVSGCQQEEGEEEDLTREDGEDEVVDEGGGDGDLLKTTAIASDPGRGEMESEADRQRGTSCQGGQLAGEVEVGDEVADEETLLNKLVIYCLEETLFNKLVIYCLERPC
jgi:hypothetical protein